MKKVLFASFVFLLIFIASGCETREQATIKIDSFITVGNYTEVRYTIYGDIEYYKNTMYAEITAENSKGDCFTEKILRKDFYKGVCYIQTVYPAIKVTGLVFDYPL